MRTLSLLVLLLFLGCQSTPDLPASARATITSVTGHAEIRHQQTATWERARPGDTLTVGDQARTSLGAQIDFNLGQNAGVLTLMPDSLLQFDQLGPKSPSDPVHAVLNLPKGRVIGDTLDLPGTTKIVVKTAGGTVEIP
jgi:hypothetical protein